VNYPRMQVSVENRVPRERIRHCDSLSNAGTMNIRPNSDLLDTAFHDRRIPKYGSII